MTLLSRTRFAAALLAAVTLASAGCTNSSPSPQPAPSPSPTAVVETTPEPSPEPSAEPPPELSSEPEDLEAYCAAVQAVHDSPWQGLGHDNPERAAAYRQVAPVAPEPEKEFWLLTAQLTSNTIARDDLSVLIGQMQEVEALVEARCGFGFP